MAGRPVRGAEPRVRVGRRIGRIWPKASLLSATRTSLAGGGNSAVRSWNESKYLHIQLFETDPGLGIICPARGCPG